MIDPSVLLIFIPAALALNLTPGSDMLFCLGQGLRSGPQAGFAASLGVATGGLVHSLLAAFGLAAVLATYPLAFEAIRWIGAAYLAWLAIATWRNKDVMVKATTVGKSGVYIAWRNGAIVNLFNPKIIIFMLAFVPQFVDPARSSTIIQFLIFGLILNIGGTLINGLVGVFAGSIGSALTANIKLAQTVRMVSSLVFLGLAAKLIFSRR